MTKRKFYYTQQSCTELHNAISNTFPNIQNLVVFLDKDEHQARVITVKFNEGLYTKEMVETFINNLQK